MAASIAFDGYGVVLKINAIALTDGEILSITDPDLAKEVLEVSHALSTGQWREFIGGWKDGQEISIELNWTQADFKLFKAEYDSTKVGYTIEIPDDNYSTTPPIFGFDAICSNITGNTDTTAKKTMTVTLRISGPVTFTDGT